VPAEGPGRRVGAFGAAPGSPLRGLRPPSRGRAGAASCPADPGWCRIGRLRAPASGLSADFQRIRPARAAEPNARGLPPRYARSARDDRAALPQQLAQRPLMQARGGRCFCSIPVRQTEREGRTTLGGRYRPFSRCPHCQRRSGPISGIDRPGSEPFLTLRGPEPAPIFRPISPQDAP
jgi:hypothetical protein